MTQGPVKWKKRFWKALMKIYSSFFMHEDRLRNRFKDVWGFRGITCSFYQIANNLEGQKKKKTNSLKKINNVALGISS